MFLILLTASLAHAQDVYSGGDVPPINAQNFTTALDSQTFLWMTDSSMMRDGAFSYRSTASYHSGLFGYEDYSGATSEFLSWVAQTDTGMAYTLGDLRMGLQVPYYTAVRGSGGVQEQGLGDLIFDFKYRFLDREESEVGLTLTARSSAPTATLDAPVATDGSRWELETGVDRLIGPVVVAVNLGYRGQPAYEMENLYWGPQLLTRLGAAYMISERTTLALENSIVRTPSDRDDKAFRSNGWQS